ncbi:hypothetical protein [Streptomyces venezuelae]|uniref:hypothetical protein n=1 Tax=Streptomyces venezuelae TaxID=54571 RepID=UPI001F42F7D3|nr:hypothetical protein [Streptomyces venezuelae]
MRSDIKNSIDIAATLTPAARTDTATGTGVDLANYDAAAVVISTGAVANGAFSIEVQESDTLGSGYTAVANADLDGTEPATLTAARGRLLRRSYRVDAVVGGHRYRLVPSSHVDSRLTRDGRKLGTLESEGDGRVDADWEPDATPTPLDHAVGTALAAAFGTGAAPWWETVGDIVAELIP